MCDIKVGDIVKCKVTGIEDYGLFVVTENNINGLIHISEISVKFVKDPSYFAKIDDEIYAKVIGFLEDGRLKLSIKTIHYKKDGSEIKNLADFNGLRKKLPIWIEEYESKE